MSVSGAAASRPESSHSRESFHDHLDPISPENDEARHSIQHLDAAVAEEVGVDGTDIFDANDVPPPPALQLTRPKSFSLPSSPLSQGNKIPPGKHPRMVAYIFLG